MNSDFLEGIKVVSLGLNVPAPLTCQQLADLGAQVTKIEPPEGDTLHHAYKKWYDAIHKKQKVLKLDLKNADHQREAQELLAAADLLITSSRPSALKRVGMSWDDVRVKFPRLCMVMILGYPPPREDEPAHDLNCQAEAGLLNPPQLPRALISDFVCAQKAVATGLALLISRAKTNHGALSQVSMMESAQWMAQAYEYGPTQSQGLLGGALPSYGLYKSKDEWLALGAIEGRFQDKLRSELKLTDLNTEELKRLFQTKTANQWQEWAKKNDIPLVIVKEN